MLVTTARKMKIDRQRNGNIRWTCEVDNTGDWNDKKKNGIESTFR